jgi:hypothetical protein
MNEGGVTHNDTRGSRCRLRTFIAAARVLIMTRPASSTPTVTGDSCGIPSRRNVASTPLWFSVR